MNRFNVVLLCTIVWCASVGFGGPVGSGFTYQGRLNDGGSPAEGLYDIRFELYDEPAAGSLVGVPLEAEDFEVIGGYFTVELDFGAGVFDGAARWLEVSVRPHDSTAPEDFVPLLPRQPITATPYALYAMSGTPGPEGPMGPMGPQGPQGLQGPVGSQGPKGDTGATGPQGDTGAIGPQGPIGLKGDTGPQGPIGPKGDKGDTGAMGPAGPTGPTLGIRDSLSLPSSGPLAAGNAGGMPLNNLGQVGIGTTTPDRPLHIRSSQGAIRVDRDGNSPAMYLVRTAPGDFSTVWKTFGLGVNADGEDSGSFFLTDMGTATGGPGTPRISIDSSGNVGIGTAEPQASLHCCAKSPEIRLEQSDFPDLRWCVAASNGYFHIFRSDSGGSYTHLMTKQNGDTGLALGGYLGVGTTLPESALHIYKENPRILLDSPAYPSPWSVSVTGSGLAFGEPKETNPLRAYFFNGGNIALAPVAGNVSIGTTDPGGYKLAVNGSAAKPGGGSWSTLSDARLKTVEGAFEAGLEEVSVLTPVRYRYRGDNEMQLTDNQEHVGLVAQDVAQAIPEAVTESDSGYLMLNNDPVIMAMLNAIKELKAENERLRGRVEALEQAADQPLIVKEML